MIGQGISRTDGPIATVATTMMPAIASQPWSPRDIARYV